MAVHALLNQKSASDVFQTRCQIFFYSFRTIVLHDCTQVKKKGSDKFTMLIMGLRLQQVQNNLYEHEHTTKYTLKVVSESAIKSVFVFIFTVTNTFTDYNTAQQLFGSDGIILIVRTSNL